MIRTLRASRSLPSLRTTALSHAQHPPVPSLPCEFHLNASRSVATSTPRTRRTKAATTTTDSPIVPTEPKRRGRPRKDSLAPTIHKRSNSTDTKSTANRKTKKADAIPTIPQPAAKDVGATPDAKKQSKKSPGTDNIPQAADKFQAQKPGPVAEVQRTKVSAADPEHVGTRVQAIGKEVTKDAEEFAHRAVEALEAGKTSGAASSLQNLLESTLSRASGSAGGGAGEAGSDKYKYEYEDKEIPQGEKTALLSALGLAGLWVAFGGRLQGQKKKKKKEKDESS